MKQIRIANLGFVQDYRQTLIPQTIESMGYHIDWVKPKNADLVIFGPEFKFQKQSLRHVPKIFRKYINKPFAEVLQTHLGSRQSLPVRLFHAFGNYRHDQISADYSISSDIVFGKANHFRLPQWMERINWSRQGITSNGNRYNGELLDTERLLKPLGPDFLSRKLGGVRYAVFKADTLIEPNFTCLKCIQSVMRVDGFGAAFDLKSPTSSSFMVNFDKVLKQYAFNLCPEEVLYPAYAADNIPIAFSAGCLPLAWVDQSISIDFNPRAFENLAIMASQAYAEAENLLSDKYLQQYCDQALLINEPSLDSLKAYLKNILREAIG